MDYDALFVLFTEEVDARVRWRVLEAIADPQTKIIRGAWISIAKKHGCLFAVAVAAANNCTIPQAHQKKLLESSAAARVLGISEHDVNTGIGLWDRDRWLDLLGRVGWIKNSRTRFRERIRSYIDEQRSLQQAAIIAEIDAIELSIYCCRISTNDNNSMIQ